MMTRYRAALDDKQLDALAAGIIITDIAYTSPAPQIVSSALAGRNGMRVQGKTYGVSGVKIEFEIHEQDVKRRQDVCKKIQGWAIDGGWLTTNDKTGLRLRVVCSELPEIRSALRWTERLSVAFTAYENPMWEEIYPTKVTANKNGEGVHLFVGGTAEETLVDVVLENTGEAPITNVSVYAGESVIELENLSLQPGEKVEIGHGYSDIICMYAGDVSCLANRTAESADDLVIKCRKRSAVGFTCDGTARATFTTRGRYV